MVKYIIASFLILSCILLNAQTFKPFKLIITAGYALPSSDYIKGGFASSLDAQYAINDKLSFGLSSGSAGIGPSIKSTFSLNEKFLGNALMFTTSGTYHFNTNIYRPFVSLASGLGIIEIYRVENFNPNAYDRPSIELSEQRVSKLIVSPGAGIEKNHLRLMAEYAYFGKAEGINSSFLTLKAGVIIGGGRRKENSSQ